MFYPIQAYLTFLYHSTNQHGVHSPFIYQFVTKVLYDTQYYPEYQLLEQYRKQLYKSPESIQVIDFGAGSRVFKSNTRSIASVARYAGISKQNARLLFRLIHHNSFNTVLELGTSLGLATSALALGNSATQIISLEGCPETAQTAQRYLQQLPANNIQVHTGNFTNLLPTLTHQMFDCIYFDGNHQKEATLAYFEQLLPTAHHSSVWIFDDIHWSKDMEQAWSYIKQHPKVTVTIDTFQWGLVFFRTEQAKEHFTIRV